MRSIVTAERTADVARVFRGQRTVRQSLRAPSRSLFLELLVESFVASTHYVSPNAQRLRAASDLPPPLERIATTVQRGSRKWLAWLDEQKTRFVVAALANRRGQLCDVAIRLAFYDEDGRHLVAGEWSLQRDGHWKLCGR